MRDHWRIHLEHRTGVGKPNERRTALSYEVTDEFLEDNRFRETLSSLVSKMEFEILSAEAS